MCALKIILLQDVWGCHLNSYLSLRLVALWWQGIRTTTIRELFLSPSWQKSGEYPIPPPPLTLVSISLCDLYMEPYTLISQYLNFHKKTTRQILLLLPLFHKRRSWGSKRLSTVCSGFLFWKMGIIILLTSEDLMSNADESVIVHFCYFLSIEFKVRFNDNF